ncbi:MAG: 30S ribosomal protein S1 [Mariprofundaceae bacterium]
MTTTETSTTLTLNEQVKNQHDVNSSTIEPPMTDMPIASSAAVAIPSEESTPEGESFEKLFEASLQQKPVLEENQLTEGLVVGIDGDNVIIDVGIKGEGVVPVSEFDTAPQLNDKIEVLIRAVGGADGLRLSVLEVRKRLAWERLEIAIVDDHTVTARIESEIKGGYRLNISGIQAFMPKSEADPDPRTPASSLIGTRCEVAVISASKRPENIVVSRKKPLEKVVKAKQAAFFESIHLGDKIEGAIKRLATFGAFVDIGGVDALLHISDISWRRINHPQEMLSVGQSITAEVIKLDREAGKVSISMRALQADPWKRVDKTYESGMRLTGTVRRLLDFGAMIEIEPGVEGMIHRSELSWTRSDANPASLLTIGDVVDVAVLSVDAEKRRIALSLKEVCENPWQAWLSENPIGSKLSGPVKSKTDFGIFVRLTKELDGLVHIGNLSWDKSGEDALADYSKGDTVETVVLGVDIDKQRIALGVKQLLDDPLDLFLAGSGKGQNVNGTVSEVKERVAIVSLADGVYGTLPMRELPREHEALKVGDSIDAKVTMIDKRKRSITLSVRKMLDDEERDALRDYAQSQNTEPAPSALALELQRKLLDKR